MFNQVDPISLLDFPQTFKRACNNLFIDEGAAAFLFSHFMLGSAKQEILHRVEGDSDTEDDSDNARSGSLRSFDEVVNHLRATYADNSTISATDSAITAL